MAHPHPKRPAIDVALQVSWLTVAWSGVTGVASAIVGLLAGSLSLAGLGVTVLIDVGSSLVLIWRFRHERDGGGSVERAERLAHRVASWALIGFAIVLAAQAVRSLLAHDESTATIAGVALAAAGVAVLPILARWKYRAADAVASAALRADAHITAVGAGIAAVTLVGLIARQALGWWWADVGAALVLAAVAARQGAAGILEAGASGDAVAVAWPTVGTTGDDEHDPGPLPAGRFGLWLDGLQGALTGQRDSDVPCDGCTACCTSSQFVHIGPDEVDALAHIPAELLFPAPRRPAGHVLMGYDEHGRCPMLIDDACSIYAHRPRTCRTYDCRVFPAAAVEPDGEAQPAIAARARRWRFEEVDGPDRARHEAVRAAAAFVRAHRGELPDHLVPTNATQHAVLAVRLHEAFVGPAPPTIDAVRTLAASFDDA